MNGNSVKDKMARINLKAVLSGFPYFFSFFFPSFFPKSGHNFLQPYALKQQLKYETKSV